LVTAKGYADSAWRQERKWIVDGLSHRGVMNLVDVIVGAEYGVNRSMFWGAAELARGIFVKSCQGQRLGYSEDRTKWTGA
jgi:hypothetical protein